MSRPILHLSLPVRSLGEATDFYVSVFESEVGRSREDWVDVWFYGMQLTLQVRPDAVVAAEEQGVRHFGVTLPDRAEFQRFVERVEAHGVRWLSAPTTHDDPELSGKVGAKLADPSGNVIEVKHYPDTSELQEP